MAQQVFAYIPHKSGVADDSALELMTVAAKLGAEATVTALVLGNGSELDAACTATAKIYPTVWKVDHPTLVYPNAELIQKLLAGMLPQKSVLLVPHDHFGMDLSPGLSVKQGAVYLPDVVAIDEFDGTSLKAVRQEFGGAVSTHVACDLSEGAVINVRSGSFPAADAASAAGQVTDKSSEAGEPATKRRFLEVIAAEVGDVDITKEDILVSVGRGIEDQENIEIAQELAEALGGVVSCSRPIVDAKWMEKSRQVGTSGQTVKPKVYLALGISGSFQHLGGLKGNPFIVAVNKNPKAPIFQVADIGIVQDILEFMPVLTEKVQEIKG